MKQKLTIFIVFAVLAAALVALNAASYSKKEKNPDSEIEPDRSTFNYGPTGTQAFYTLLSETGRSVVRWQEPADTLMTKKKNVPKTFVIVGPVRRPYKDAEITGLLRWVSSGGRLVIIDREPADGLVTTTGNWKVKIEPQDMLAIIDADPSEPKSMTFETPAVKPSQPSALAAGVNAIQPSRFAAAIKFEPLPMTQSTPLMSSAPPPMAVPKGSATPVVDEEEVADEPAYDPVDTPSLYAPVVHAGSKGKNILVDVPFGDGRITYLSDPYIVANGGINLADNARLAINLVSGTDGVIAFDEFHHGFGADNNRLLEFFAGTPVVAVFFQCLLLVGLIFFSQSRRFARALPDAEPDRLSKLEYVSAMAELQQRTRAYDLAVENIYRDFRRRATRLLGLDNTTVTRGELAARISERTTIDRGEIEDLLFKCDEIIVGEPTNKREVVNLTARIREAEYRLGLRKQPEK
ncbi:MAG: DUF4350 domain-containing protein [Pyrinomonadaceae bacterium]|nr:DUF4350 domain-containing protein [Pyrinomonadaceae bacterium]MBP6212193.1 DUF4350 domain-containing protein [Pyrinomonadaceae bacterium]